MTDENTILISREQIGKAFGKLGGDATSKKYGREHFKRLAEKRWAKKPKAK